MANILQKKVVMEQINNTKEFHFAFLDIMYFSRIGVDMQRVKGGNGIEIVTASLVSLKA